MLGLIPLHYRIAAALTLFVAACAFSWLHGYRTADKSAQLASLAKELAQVQAARDEWLRQAETAQDIARKAVARQQQAQAEADEVRDELEAYAAELAARQECNCGLTHDDVRRLRDLTAPRRDPARPAGTPLDLRPGSGPRP